MYQVVIIDDEPVIVQGLSRLVPWEKYGCVVAGTAEDGREGLARIRECKPDIVFTDIYMPQMDGLTMVAAIKSEFEEIQVSILTGYRDFALVQKALNLGVTRFLLKPSNLKDLEEAVAEMTKRLNKRQGALPMAEQAEEERPEEPGAGQAGRFLVKQAISYIEENYRGKLTLTQVAEHVYVSQWHLSKLLNQYTGKTFPDLLNETRIREARELLKDPAMRVADVAEQVGFSDNAHFARVFKKVTGVSANAYRNSL